MKKHDKIEELENKISSMGCWIAGLVIAVVVLIIFLFINAYISDKDLTKEICGKDMKRTII